MIREKCQKEFTQRDAFISVFRIEQILAFFTSICY
jgi:hypothetical protein